MLKIPLSKKRNESIKKLLVNVGKNGSLKSLMEG
jgi:hypothetical protein